MIRLLFICSLGQVRSVCGFNLFYTLYPTHYFGLSGDPQIDHLDEWCTEAEYIFVFSEGHVSYFQKYHPQYLSKIHNLMIDDIWGNPNVPALKDLIWKKVKKILPYDFQLETFDYQAVNVKPIKELELKNLNNFWNKIEKKN